MGKLPIQGTLFDTLWQVFVFFKVVFSFMEHRKKNLLAQIHIVDCE